MKIGIPSEMYLCEKQVVQPNGVRMHEIHKLTKTVQPVSAAMTNFIKDISLIAL